MQSIDQPPTLKGDGTCTAPAPQMFIIDKDSGNCTVPEGVAVLQPQEMPYEDRSRIVCVNLPESLQQIDDKAFYDFKSLQTIHIPNGVTRIGKLAFKNCVKLKSVKLPDSLEEIDDQAFCACGSLQYLHMPTGVRRIGKWAFYLCRKLKSVRLPPSLQEMDVCAFGCCNEIKSIIVPEGVTKLGKSAFHQCQKLHTVKLPETLRVIDEETFDKCSSLQTVIIPQTLTEIKNRAFADCFILRLICLPKDNITVHKRAFVNCNELKRQRRVPGAKRASLLQVRFDNLPLHQHCYSPNGVPLSVIASYMDRGQFGVGLDIRLIATDNMELTPLQVLCSNPCATPDMIKKLIAKNWIAAMPNSKTKMSAKCLYLICKSVISHKEFQSFHSIEFQRATSTTALLEAGAQYNVSPIAISLLKPGARYSVCDMINMGLEYDVMDVLLALNGVRPELLRYDEAGICLEEELKKRNEDSGLYPFMSAALSHNCALENVYKMALKSFPALKKNQTHGEKRKRKDQG